MPDAAEVKVTTNDVDFAVVDNITLDEGIMAHIIGDDFEGKFIETEVEFTDGDQALEDFFARTPRAPGSILDATWFTGTPILPEVVPTRARIIEGNALYDWRTVHGGPTLVSARFKDCVEELDPGRHASFR